MLRIYSLLKNLLKRKVARAENFDTERARSKRRPAIRCAADEESRAPQIRPRASPSLR
jgi:hypothetical protein